MRTMLTRLAFLLLPCVLFHPNLCCRCLATLFLRLLRFSRGLVPTVVFSYPAAHWVATFVHFNSHLYLSFVFVCFPCCAFLLSISFVSCFSAFLVFIHFCLAFFLLHLLVLPLLFVFTLFCSYYILPSFVASSCSSSWHGLAPFVGLLRAFVCFLWFYLYLSFSSGLVRPVLYVFLFLFIVSVVLHLLFCSSFVLLFFWSSVFLLVRSSVLLFFYHSILMFVSYVNFCHFPGCLAPRWFSA